MSWSSLLGIRIQPFRRTWRSTTQVSGNTQNAPHSSENQGCSHWTLQPRGLREETLESSWTRSSRAAAWSWSRCSLVKLCYHIQKCFGWNLVAGHAELSLSFSILFYCQQLSSFSLELVRSREVFQRFWLLQVSCLHLLLHSHTSESTRCETLTLTSWLLELTGFGIHLLLLQSIWGLPSQANEKDKRRPAASRMLQFRSHRSQSTSPCKGNSKSQQRDWLCTSADSSKQRRCCWQRTLIQSLEPWRRWCLSAMTLLPLVHLFAPSWLS